VPKCQELLLPMFRTGFKKIIYLLHLWLGLFSGLVVFMIGLTGSIYSFSEEIKGLIYHDRLYINVLDGTKKQSFNQLLFVAQKKLGEDKKISRVEIQQSPDRTYMFRAYKAGKYFEKIYLNPYTAQIVFHEDANKEFFNVVLSIHRTLLLGDVVGHFIIRWSVVCFVILLISGIVLWWPKKWKMSLWKQKLKVKWEAKPKRLNYDLHQVFGFYAFLILLIISFTGLMWSFDLVADKKVKVFSDTTSLINAAPNDLIIAKMKSFGIKPTYLHYNLPNSKSGTVNVSAYLDPQRIHQKIQYRFDRYSGKLLLEGKPFYSLSALDKVKALNYDLHTGSIFGFWGKLLVFIAGLITASLPITGFFIWLWRKKGS
jgi:uncharacterized iron-regulated membrane protein